MTNERPRILLAVTADKSLLLLSGFPSFLVDRGWDVHIVCSPGPKLTELRKMGTVTTHELPMKREPSLVADVRALLAWIRLLRRVRPEMTSIGTPKAALLGGIAAWVTRVPHRIYLLRGLRLETAVGLQRMILLATEKVALGTAKKVIAVSSSLRSRAIELRLVASRKIAVLGDGSSNGVSVSDFDPERFDRDEVARLRQRMQLQADIPVVGFVGRLAKDKGLAEFAEACLSMARGGVPFQVLIVGGIEDEVGTKAFERVRSAGRNVVEAGHVDDTAIYYQLMDVFCLPTYREGFPNVVLEAGASGLATVTTNATGAVDSVIDGETGIIVGVGDSAGLARALHQLVDDATTRARLGTQARAFVAERFERVAVWERTESFQRRMLEAYG